MPSNWSKRLRRRRLSEKRGTSKRSRRRHAHSSLVARGRRCGLATASRGGDHSSVTKTRRNQTHAVVAMERALERRRRVKTFCKSMRDRSSSSSLSLKTSSGHKTGPWMSLGRGGRGKSRRHFYIKREPRLLRSAKRNPTITAKRTPRPLTPRPLTPRPITTRPLVTIPVTSIAPTSVVRRSERLIRAARISVKDATTRSRNPQLKAKRDRRPYRKL